MDLKQFFNKNKEMIYLVVAVILVVIVFYYLTSGSMSVVMPSAAYAPRLENFEEPRYYDNAPDADANVQENFEMDPKSDASYLVLFFAPWCGHCKRFMEGKDSIWEQLKKKHGNPEDVKFDQVNCDEEEEVAKKFNIKSFPTILKIKKDKVTPFEGDRSVKGLEEFLSK